MRPCHLAIAVASLLVWSSPSLRAAADGIAAGRELVHRHADAIISVELVVTLKLKAGDREMPPREQRVDVNGTVISSTGLTVASLAAVDPQTSFEAARAAGTSRGVELVGSEFKEVKLRLGNGTEVPARFVLKDVDLDLAFMAPVAEEGAAAREFVHIQLDSPAEAGLLDRCYYVSRANKALQRTPLVRATDVAGIIEKPRRFYLMTDNSVGAPVFDSSGRLLGITLQHFANGRQAGVVVLPTADIAEMAKQAADAQTRPAEAAEPTSATSPAPATN